MTDSCAGECCAVFPLHRTKMQGVSPEWAVIEPMLIPLTRRQALRRVRRLGYADPPKYDPKQYDLFTCKNWDEKTRLCGIYETRPNMCRDYPYEGRKCERGCGYALGQADCDRIAERKDATYRWDIEAEGWRPRSNTHWVWDESRGVLVAR